MNVEKAWRGFQSYSAIILEDGFVNMVMEWLEKDDSEVERLIGYSLCLAALTYFLTKLCQVLFS